MLYTAIATANTPTLQEGKSTNLWVDLSGRLRITGGGSASPLTTKGDIYTFTTAGARLPVGTDGQVLLADSTQATGLRWGAGTSAWNLAGNTGTTPATQFVGTTDSQDLNFRTNNVQRLNISATGVISTSGNIVPITDNTLSLGTNLFRFNAAHISGSGGLFVDGDTGTVNRITMLHSGSVATIQTGATNTLNLATNATTGDITLGGTAQTGDLNLQTGTGDINIGIAGAKTITVGNTTGATAVTVRTGTNPTVITTNQPLTGSVLRLTNAVDTIDTFITNTTPESAITGSIGDLAVNSTGGTMYIKKTGTTTNTGWQEIVSVSALQTKTSSYSTASTDNEVYLNPSAAMAVTLASTLPEGKEFGFSGTVDSANVITFTAGAGTTIEDPVSHIAGASFDTSAWSNGAEFSFTVIKANNVWRLRGV